MYKKRKKPDKLNSFTREKTQKEKKQLFLLKINKKKIKNEIPTWQKIDMQSN